MAIRYPYRKPIIAKPAPSDPLILSTATKVVLETYQGSYGNLTHNGQARLITVLELALRMSTSDLIQAISDLKEMEPTV